MTKDWQDVKDKLLGVVKRVLPWYVDLAVELLFLLPDVVKAVKSDPEPNKQSVKKVAEGLRGVVGEAPELKNI